MSPPALVGIHHVKFPVRDLAVSRPWYEKVYGLTPHLEFRDVENGPVMGVAYQPKGGFAICLRVQDSAATGCAGFDPVSFAITDRSAAEEWVAHLDGLGIDHSPIIDATIGWLVVFHDPDGIEHHLYSVAAHGLDPRDRPGAGLPPVAELDR